jgi:hypothetical protein
MITTTAPTYPLGHRLTVRFARRLPVLRLLAALAAGPLTAAAAGTIEATLNGLKITLDEQSGSIVGLEYPGPGKMLTAKPETAGLIDLAYPIPEFEPLRLASRFSTGARIEKTADAVVISWDNVGASRPYFKADGTVSAKVWLQALPDGRSITMKCQVVNDSKRNVGQVLFPDFHGLLPFAGREETCLRTPGFVRQPFVDVGATTYPEFYALDRLSDSKEMVEFYGGGKYGNADSMIGRWLDFGGLKGGFSLFPKVWAGAPQTKVRMYRLEKDPNVRLMHKHDITIKPGATWDSPEYVLTPHRNNWAKGIEPYREFVQGSIKRQFPVPAHVRDGVGYRTIWVCKGFPADGDRDVAFKARDLPAVAREAKAHGLDELVIWFWQEPFMLPTPPPYRHLGTPEEFSKAIKECNQLGVNVSLFISIYSIAEPTASRYGWKVPATGGWTYHTEMIPRFNPTYANGRSTRGVQKNDPSYPLWRQDVITSIKDIYANYSQSICWDQANPALEDVFAEFLPWAKARDPRATFSGEIIGSSERSASFLDYTWNWESGSYHHNGMAPYRDDRGFTASFPSPRLNKGINRNAEHIKLYFMDNNYLNVMPNAPDDANGTAWIKDFPEVSRILKQCAALRRQFLSYFTKGTLIADGLLQQPAPGTHLGTYVLPDRVLFMVMNTQDAARAVSFNLDLQPWLKSASGSYEVKSYDQHGQALKPHPAIKSTWKGTTAQLQKNEIAIYEFIAK